MTAPTLSMAAPNGCGPCTLCCKLKRVDELAKAPNAWCPHCTPGRGCGVYETRPAGCREWECMYVAFGLPDALRPDRVRCILEPGTGGRTLVVTVDPARPDAYRAPAVWDFLRSQLATGKDVLVVTGRHGRRIDHRTGRVTEHRDINR